MKKIIPCLIFLSGPFTWQYFFEAVPDYQTAGGIALCQLTAILFVLWYLPLSEKFHSRNVEKCVPPVDLPLWLYNMSMDMNADPSNMTSHPFWQVRCKRYLVTQEGYNDHHWILADDDGEFFRSDGGHCHNEVIKERYPEWAAQWALLAEQDFLDYFDPMDDEFPENVTLVYVQEIEEIVTTHFTKNAAERFIARKQHDYPKLYPYAESAYWAPQFRDVQDWIKGLTA